MTIDLSNAAPFASGANRHCYRHPAKPNLCLKVLRPENIEARFQRQPWPKKLLGRGRIDDNRQEQLAYQQAAIRHLMVEGKEELVWRHLPRLYVAEETTAGMANVSDLILDRKHKPAQTLESYLKENGFDPKIQNAVNEFCEWLISTSILTRNLLPHNLVVDDTKENPRLVLVDGLGAPTFPTQLALIPAWRRRYISRRVKRFFLRIQWELGDKQESWEASQRL